MGLLKKASTKGKQIKEKVKTAPHQIVDAYVLTKNTGDAIIQALGELPHKYINISPILQVLRTSVRSTLTVELPVGVEVPTLVNNPPPQPAAKESIEEKPMKDEK